MASNFPLSRGRELAEMAMSKNLKQSKYPVCEKLRIQLFEPPDAEVTHTGFAASLINR